MATSLFSKSDAALKIRRETGVQLADAELRALAKMRGVQRAGNRFIFTSADVDALIDDLRGGVGRARAADRAEEE